ncbi:hypothetical protein [Streptomyces sp. NRRL B-1347]|uniref:hypothetical protein n=1 Tax=Streptomyces sp. NRRL B-1347 TaxID=1476877 RepID=UPI0018FE3EDE|nr:hypothetical protein [Streptomyces sp. NRRL B-1347]
MIADWLAQAHPLPGKARREWTDAYVAMIPLGRRFDAVRVPARRVHAAVASEEPATLAAALRDWLRGPVIRDLRSPLGAYYSASSPTAPKRRVCTPLRPPRPRARPEEAGMPDPKPVVLLAALPGIDTLGPAQLSGSACVWCEHTFRPGEGIDLGGPGPFRPHGCLDCCETRTNSLSTYLAWYDHTVTCLRCPFGPCEPGQALGTAHLAVRERAGHPSICCAACGTTIAPGEALRPHFWREEPWSMFGYLHARDCPASASRPTTNPIPPPSPSYGNNHPRLDSPRAHK